MSIWKRIALVVAVPLILASCASSGLFSGGLDTRAGVVDGASAARMISDYRRSRGLGPVSVNAKLTRLAADQARRMAQTDTLDHRLPGQTSFKRRIAQGGYHAALVAENVGAGYQSLETAIARWQASPSHDANLLLPEIKEIGIAVAHVPEGRYTSYWALVLADPLPPGAIVVSDR